MTTDRVPPTTSIDVDGLRIAIFTHDTYGLGHVRRSLHIIRALARLAPRASILLITGSPTSRLFDELPPNVDYIKIPTVVKTGSKRYRPPHLPLPLSEVSLLRSSLIEEAVRRFSPDVFLVDNFPLGSGTELLAALKELRRGSAVTILGLRDVLDAPEVVQADWKRQGIYEVIDRYYDRILIYGTREVMTVEQAYAMPPAVAEKVRYCGYVTADDATLKAEEVRARLGINKPFLLATTGGGGDGFPLLRTFLEALPMLPGLPAVVVTGPLMSSAQRSELEGIVNGSCEVQILDYVRDLRSYVSAADVVVSMCGYNTAAEIVALGSRAVVVPRTWRYGEHLRRDTASVEWEQLLRAEALTRLGLLDMVRPQDLQPDLLADRIRHALDTPRRESAPGVALNGLRNVIDQIVEAATQRGGKQLVS